jgi:hypothetical protein
MSQQLHPYQHPKPGRATHHEGVVGGDAVDGVHALALDLLRLGDELWLRVVYVICVCVGWRGEGRWKMDDGAHCLHGVGSTDPTHTYIQSHIPGACVLEHVGVKHCRVLPCIMVDKLIK